MGVHEEGMRVEEEFVQQLNPPFWALFSQAQPHAHPWDSLHEELFFLHLHSFYPHLCTVVKTTIIPLKN